MKKQRDYITIQGKRYKIHRDKHTGIASVCLPPDVLTRIREEKNEKKLDTGRNATVASSTHQRAGTHSDGDADEAN